MSTPEWFLQHGRVYPTRFGSIGVMHLSDPAVDGLPARVRLSLKADRGGESVGRFGVGDEFLVGPEIWRVVSITGAGARDYTVHVVLVGAEGEADEDDDGWVYYLGDQDANGVAELVGQVIRVRAGDSLMNGLVATKRGRWAKTDWLFWVLEEREYGNADRISATRARALLTGWVAARQLVRLPEDIRPLGSLVSGGLWDYFLVTPSGEGEADVAGEVLRCRPGGPFADGWRFGGSGEWETDDRLERLWWRGEGPGSAFPIGEQVAGWLMTWWVRLGRFPRLPADVPAAEMPWAAVASGEWEFFTVRSPGRQADPERVTGPVMAHRRDTTYREGYVYSPAGHWNRNGRLLYALVLGNPRQVIDPISEQTAREVIEGRYGQGSFHLPDAGERLGGTATTAVVDRRGYVMLFDVAVPRPGSGLVRGFVIDGSAYDSAERLDAEVRATGDWLDARWIVAERESVPVGSCDVASLGLPSWQQFRAAAERDERGFEGWPSWEAAAADLATSLSPSQLDVLGEAYGFAAQAHHGQTRPAGEPYTSHLLEVLQILAVGVGSTDTDQLVAALLHDVVEDTPVTLDEVRERFGPVVAELVGRVTMPPSQTAEPLQIGGPSPTGDREQARLTYLGHLRQAPSAVRALKLADRYSNVQRLHTHPRPDKQQSYFAETVGNIVPLAAGDPFFQPLFLAWQQRMGRDLGIELTGEGPCPPRSGRS